MVDAKLRVFVIIFSNYSQLNIPQHILRQLRDLSCEETAKQLGMNVKRQMMSCPWHTDKKPSLGFKGNHWKCFSCDRGGDAIELVRQLYSLLLLMHVVFYVKNSTLDFEIIPLIVFIFQNSRRLTRKTT